MSIADKLTVIAENMQDVYDKGFVDGQSQGGSDEYRTLFWNGIQDNGNRTDYQHVFRGWKNADKYWKPIYDIQATTYAFAFYGCDMNGASLPELCEQAGITIDYSKSSNANQCFSYCNIGDVGTIDTRNWGHVGSVLMYADSVKKAHLILKYDGSQTLVSSFDGATSLTDLTIEGVVGNNITIPSTLLNQDSIISIISSLGAGVTGQTLTLSNTAVTTAFGSTESDEWKALVASKSNWTISLA